MILFFHISWNQQVFGYNGVPDLFEFHVLQLVLTKGNIPHTHHCAGPSCDDDIAVGTSSTHSLSPVRQTFPHGEVLIHTIQAMIHFLKVSQAYHALINKRIIE